MPIEGTPKLSRLQLAQLTVDMTKPSVEIRTLIALIDPNTGQAAYAKQDGSVWSVETQAALRELISCVEQDASRHLLLETLTAPPRPSVQHKPQSSGLGETLTAGDGDVPSM